MIQRIQSVYLTLTLLLSVIFLNGSILTFTDKSDYVIKVTFNGTIYDKGLEGIEHSGTIYPVLFLIILIAVVAFTTIFLFKNRKVQMLFTLAEIILTAGLIPMLIFYSFNIILKYGATIVFSAKLVIPVLLVLFSVLSYYGIRKDDRLVRSYDRLR